MPKAKLLKALLGVSAVAALFAAVAVQAQAPAAAQASRGTPGQAAAGEGAQEGAKLNKQDQKMLKDMAMTHMAEVEAARLAQSKSQSEQVKNFAQQMIDDHNKALADVQQLAETKGVTLPTELDKAHKARAHRLATLSGERFDRMYMGSAGVADHKKAHTMLSQAEAQASDPELKALAARTLPIVDQHLNSAQQLRKDSAQGSSKTQGTTETSPDKKY